MKGRVIKQVDKRHGLVMYIYRNINSSQNGVFHREDGPALEYTNGYRVWYKMGKYYREDGPARIWQNGKEEYYLNDKLYSKEDYYLKIKLDRLKEL